MSSTNEFMLDVIARLNKQLSKRSINDDLKSLNDTMYVRVLAKLSKSLASKELKKQLKGLDNLYVNVGIKADKGAKDKIQKNIKILQKSIADIEVGLEASKMQQKKLNAQIEGIRKNVQKKVSSEPLEFSLQIKKNKLISDIEYTGKRFSKLFSSESASKKYEAMMQRAFSVSDKGQLSDARAELAAFTSEMKASGLASKSVGDRWKDLTARAKDLFSAASIVRVAFGQVKEAVSTTVDLDKTYTDLIKVQSELTRNDYPDYLERCNKKAQELATTQKALIEGATEFSKSGYNLETSNGLTEKSTILSNVGEMSASDSAKAIISGVQAYDTIDGYTDVVDKAGALIDKYNELGNTASITTSELAQGVQSVGSVFADANTSVDEFLALLSSANRQYQNADTLALALRTSALRIRGASVELEEAGEDIEGVMSTLDNQKAIKALTGVDILEKDQETIRSIYDIFLDISKVYKDMSDVDQSALLEIIAGKHRASAISATLNNMTEAETVLQNSLNAAGSAQREYDAYLDSTEAHIQQFQAKLVETYSTFMNGNMISHVADLGTAILNLVNHTDLLKHSLISIAALKIGQGIATVGSAISGTISQMNTLGNALQQVRNLPLDETLRKDVIKDIGTATKDLTEKNLGLLLSQKQLGEQDRIDILLKHKLTEEEALAKLEKLGLTDATNANTAANAANTSSVNTLKGAFTGLKASAQAAWVAMSTLEKASVILAAVSTIWSIGSAVMSGFKQSAEEAIQSAKEAADTYKESSSSMDDYISRYSELREQLIAAKGNEEETYNVKKQLLDLQTELNGKYGEEHGYLNLVTDAYKNQTQAIKELNEEEARRFLNENEQGISAAEREMESKKTYDLSYAIAKTPDNEEFMEEIVGKYEKDGMSILDAGESIYIKLDADPKDAYETINSFMTDVQDKAKSLGNENLFKDTVSNIASNSLNKAKETLDKHQEIYKQAQMANIVSNDNLSEGYDKAVSAVEAYNEAVLESEDPYNDESVSQAWNSLQTVKRGIQENEAEWGKYSNIMDDVFSAANDDVYSFYQTLQNDTEVKELAGKLKGLSDIDLQAMADDGNNGDPFDILYEKAEEYGLEVQDLIGLLVKLGYVQGEISKEAQEQNTQPLTFKEAWESLDTTENENLKSLKDDLLSLAEAGQLTLEKFTNTTGSSDFLMMLGIEEDDISEIDGLIARINKLKSSADQLSSMKKGISSLSGI